MAMTVKTFYDEHPINESEILEKLAKDGIAQDAVTAEDLSRYDIDHYGGLEATDTLVAALGIEPARRCSISARAWAAPAAISSTSTARPC